MNTVVNQFLRHLRLFAAVALLLAVPFVAVVPRAAAMDDHAMNMHQSDATLDCATACALAMNTPTTTIINEDESLTPAPEPQEIVPYYQQFQAIPLPKKLLTTTSYITLPGKPPDIVKMSGHFLF